MSRKKKQDPSDGIDYDHYTPIGGSCEKCGEMITECAFAINPARSEVLIEAVCPRCDRAFTTLVSIKKLFRLSREEIRETYSPEAILRDMDCATSKPC